MKVILLLTAFAGVVVAALLSGRPSATAHTLTSACRPASDDFTVFTLSRVRVGVTNPQAERVRIAMGIPRVPAESVVLVTTDSACARAIVLINRHVGVADSVTRSIVLVKVAQLHWAEDPALRAGEWTRTFLLDSALTRIVSTH